VEIEFYQDLLDQISDGVYLVTRQRRITYWNAGAERITGYNAHEVLGHSCAEGILRHVDNAGQQLCLSGCPLAAVMEDGKSREALVYLHHKDGHCVPVMVRGEVLRDPAGKIVGSVQVFSATIAGSSVGQRRLRKDNSLDSVTGLALRRFGDLQLQTLMRLVTEGILTLGVLSIDLDHFTEVNDTFGHDTGDEVLRMIGQFMSSGLRRGDVAARWGGTTFLVLLPGTDQGGLNATGERVRMLVENSWILSGKAQVRVTVSVGATMARPSESADDLVDRAAAFVEASKRGGRNRVTTDTGEVISTAGRPILGTAMPWETQDQLSTSPDPFSEGHPPVR
jgi:diguanylate cyclase (GGDEF)-like protein/PAS domain S-box-containing protein